MEQMVAIDPNGAIPTSREFPLYEQLPNACGLASILSMINPDQDNRVDQFLADLSYAIKDLMPDFRASNRVLAYQYALQYLLTKAQGTGSKKSLYHYLNTRFSSAYDDQKVVNNALLGMKKEKFLKMDMMNVVKAYDAFILGEQDFIVPEMLDDEIRTMKTDLEIKLLMELLGFHFQTVKCCDVTGSLTFVQKDNTEALHSLIESFIHPDRRILYGAKEHWMVVVGMQSKNPFLWQLKNGKIDPKLNWKDVSIILNDPLGPNKREIALKELPNDARFYIFENRKENLSWLWADFLELVKKEFPDELKTIPIETAPIIKNENASIAIIKLTPSKRIPSVNSAALVATPSTPIKKDHTKITPSLSSTSLQNSSQISEFEVFRQEEKEQTPIITEKYSALAANLREKLAKVEADADSGWNLPANVEQSKNVIKFIPKPSPITINSETINPTTPIKISIPDPKNTVKKLDSTIAEDELFEN